MALRMNLINSRVNRWGLLEPTNYFCTNKLIRFHSSETQIGFSKFIKNKKKVITRKRYSQENNNIPKVLEWKDASSVMKRLNWENSQLYGPVQSVKSQPYTNTKIHESNYIIQHHTEVPIREPPPFTFQQHVIADIRESEQNEVFDFSALLDFPLMNKNVSSDNTNQTINEVNFLRKKLEIISTDSVPSVSHILEKTMPAENVGYLEKWKETMIEKLGEDGFKKYHKELLQKGKSLHSSINSYLASSPESEISVEEVNKGHWKSLKSIFPHISDVRLLEEKLTHPFLRYKGIVDCFATYKNNLVVIDWKTSKKAKSTLSSTFDNPLQIAAYVGALNFDTKFQYLVSKGLIVVAYENGTPATGHFIDEHKMQGYWREWLNRVRQYWNLLQKERLSQS